MVTRDVLRGEADGGRDLGGRLRVSTEQARRMVAGIFALLFAFSVGTGQAEEGLRLLPRGQAAMETLRLPAGEIPGARQSAWLLATVGDDGQWQELDWEELAAAGGWNRCVAEAREAAEALRARVQPLPEREGRVENLRGSEASGAEVETVGEGNPGDQEAAAAPASRRAEARAILPELGEVVRFEGPGVGALLADPAGLLAAWEGRLGEELVVLVGGADRLWLLPRLSPHRDRWLRAWPGQDDSGWAAVDEVLLLDANGLRVLEEPAGRKPLQRCAAEAGTGAAGR